MVAVLSTGQLTLIDFNDAVSMQAYITSSQPRTQMFNPDNGAYNPDWSVGATNVTLTPTIFKMGTGTNLATDPSITSITWWEVTNGTEVALTSATTGYSVEAVKPHKLTINKNVMAGKSSLDIRVKITYHDPTLDLDLPVVADISFSKVTNGSGIVDAVAMLPNGNIFKNEKPATLTAQCDLWRGSTIDTSLVTYQWFQQDPTATDATNPDTTLRSGWKKLTNVTNVITGVTTNNLIIYPDAVHTYEVFLCQIRDTDSTSASFNQYFKDTVTVADQSDPVQCTVLSSAGTIFRNGVGSTILTAKLYQAGAEIDGAGTKYTYKWYKYFADGSQDVNFGGTGIKFKTGKTLSVGGGDVDLKATFNVEVEG